MRCKVFLIILFFVFLIQFVPAPYLYSAYWNVTEANEGQPVKLVVAGEGLIGHPISFKIYERNEGGTDTIIPSQPSNIIFEGKTNEYYTFDYATWNAYYQDDTSNGETNPPEYYFVAQVADREPGTLTTAQSSTIYAEMLKVYREKTGSGAIWTTKGDCGNINQDVNHFAIGEVVYINGEGFSQGTYPWEIAGNGGSASADPGVTVASGTRSVGSSGAFCFRAYTIADDDWGEYNVNFNDKSDNYRVDPRLENECELTQVYWEVTSAFEDEEVRLIIKGTDACAGQEISFIVKEDDAFPNPDDSVRVEPRNIIFNPLKTNYAYWIAEGQDDDDSDSGQSYPPEYYFIATVDSIEKSLKSSNLLEVLNRDIACSGTEYCSDYKNKLECEADKCEVGKNSIPKGIICGESFNSLTGCIDNTDCRCFWDLNSNSCDGGWEVESKCSCTTNDECWLAGDLCQENCTCYGKSIPDGQGSCDYYPNVCVPNEDECWIMGAHCKENCICEEGYDPNKDGTCGEGYLSPGTCIYKDIGEDTCEDDGLLVRIQTASWIWAPGNEQLQYDPLGRHLQCVNREDVFVCPESVEVPFFGLYNFIVTSIITLLIYLVILFKIKNKN